MEQINYCRKVEYYGKNSGHVNIGMLIDKYSDRITFTPIHSKNGRGKCWIEFPKEDIQKLIDILEKFK